MGRGDLVYVVYWERAHGEDANPKGVFPRKRECLGWLDHENDRFIRVVYDRVVSATAEAGLKEIVAICRAIPKKDVENMQLLTRIEASNTFISTVIADGRITVPSNVRKEHDIKEGDSVEAQVIRKIKKTGEK